MRFSGRFYLAFYLSLFPAKNRHQFILCSIQKVPGTDGSGGVFSSRIFSFSAGVARKYTSVVLTSEWPNHKDTFRVSPVDRRTDMGTLCVCEPDRPEP